MVESETPEAITIVNPEERVTIPSIFIVQRKTSEQSVMPNGLLDQLDERQIRDLFGYLQR